MSVKIYQLVEKISIANTSRNRQGNSQTVSLPLAIKKLFDSSTIVPRQHQQQLDTYLLLPSDNLKRRQRAGGRRQKANLKVDFNYF